MNGIRKRLEQDLRTAVGRLRQVGGAAALDDLLGPSGEHWAYADEIDEIQANERREIGFATRELLVGKVNRIVAALERLDQGEYGQCVECSEAIAWRTCFLSNGGNFGFIRTVAEPGAATLSTFTVRSAFSSLTCCSGICSAYCTCPVRTSATRVAADGTSRQMMRW